MTHTSYAESAKQALDRLLDYFAGNKAQMAAAIGVSRNAVSRWFTNGRIGRTAAMLVDADPRLPFSKEELRPDIKEWSAYRQPAR